MSVTTGSTPDGSKPFFKNGKFTRENEYLVGILESIKEQQEQEQSK
jgi:hypothetical protein